MLHYTNKITMWSHVSKCVPYLFYYLVYHRRTTSDKSTSWSWELRIASEKRHEETGHRTLNQCTFQIFFLFLLGLFSSHFFAPFHTFLRFCTFSHIWLLCLFGFIIQIKRNSVWNLIRNWHEMHEMHEHHNCASHEN